MAPLANIKAVHLLEDELVRKIVGYGESLSAELARYSMHTDADIAAFDALLAQEYKVEPRETKGNRTFTSYDGLLKVQVAVAQRIRMGSSLEEAKAVLDAMIRERGEGVDPFLITLIQRAFKVDQEGKVDVRSILALRRLDVDDPRWPDFCRAIDDAVQPDGSKRYVRLSRRATIQAPWQMVPLDLAAVQPTPAALEHPSLRRQVEQLQAELELAKAPQAITVDTAPSIDFLARMDLGGLPADVLLRHAKVLTDTAMRVALAASGQTTDADERKFVAEVADALAVAGGDFDTALNRAQ
jgi:hypothetical protein